MCKGKALLCARQGPPTLQGPTGSGGGHISVLRAHPLPCEMCQKHLNVVLKEIWVQTGKSKATSNCHCPGAAQAVGAGTEMPFYTFLPPFCLPEPNGHISGKG